MNHYWKKVPGWGKFLPLYAEVVKNAKGGEKFVEIGCWKGRSAAFMGVEIINSKKDIEFICIDTFLGSDEPAHHSDPDVKNGRLFEVFTRNLQPVTDVLKTMRVIRGDSSSSAELFEDESIDFILIDGDHTYEGVSKDLRAWYPKMKKGAIIAGDDINWEGVERAVNEIVKDYTIEGEGKGRYWRAVK